MTINLSLWRQLSPRHIFITHLSRHTQYPYPATIPPQSRHCDAYHDNAPPPLLKRDTTPHNPFKGVSHSLNPQKGRVSGALQMSTLNYAKGGRNSTAPLLGLTFSVMRHDLKRTWTQSRHRTAYQPTCTCGRSYIDRDRVCRALPLPSQYYLRQTRRRGYLRQILISLR